MKELFFLFLFLLNAIGSFGQDTPTPTQLKITKEIQQIKDNTNWNNAEETRKAMLQIDKLMEEIDKDAGQPVTHIDTTLKEKSIVMGQDMADKLAADIIKELEIDTTYVSSDYINALSVLIIDLNAPDPRYPLESIGDFVNLHTLVISGNGSPIDLETLFNKLEDKSITELLIVHNGNGTNTIPENLGKLIHLEKLGLYGNSITALPASIKTLTNLQVLYIDVNPIAKLPLYIESLQNLKELGIAKTGIGAEEMARIKKLIPNCKLLTE